MLAQVAQVVHAHGTFSAHARQNGRLSKSLITMICALSTFTGNPDNVFMTDDIGAVFEKHSDITLSVPTGENSIACSRP
jgi:hypothetical protein